MLARNDDDDNDDDDGILRGYEAGIVGAGDMTGQSNPVKQLADALHDCVEPPGRTERTERLADALQECLNEAVRSGAKAAREEIRREINQEFKPRFDKQDATLRLMWKQMKGNGKLPIDD